MRNNRLAILIILFSIACQLSCVSIKQQAFADSFINSFYELIESGATEQVKKIAAENPGIINTLNEYYFTPLMQAVESNRYDIAVFLLEHGADIRASKNGWTSLHIAAYLNYPDIALLLLKKGADPNSRNKSGNTPLHIASWYHADKTAENLLDFGASVSVENVHLFNPLHYAVWNGSPRIVKLLIDRGADFHKRLKSNYFENQTQYADFEGYTLLHLAAYGAGGFDASEKVNEVKAIGYNNHGSTTCDMTSCPPDTFSLLIKRGLSINETDKAGNTPLHILVTRLWNTTPDVLQNLQECASLLISHGADLNALNGRRLTPLFSIPYLGDDAEKQSQEFIAGLFLKNGALPYLVNSRNQVFTIIEDLLFFKGKSEYMGVFMSR
jgi:ankyrin repeat protein